VWQNCDVLKANCLGAAVLLGTVACSNPRRDAIMQGSASTRLRAVTSPLPQPTVQRTVYVPVYSSIYLGVDLKHDMMDLAVTVSVRNVSARQRIVLDHVRYYDSDGRMVREYLGAPSELAPLASVEFVVAQMDKAGGPGANFLVQWTGPADVDEPVIEAVMIGNGGNVGYSFVSAGRNVKNEPLP
jgi:hypothetical protein